MISIVVDGCPRNTPVALVWSTLGEVRRGDVQDEPVFVETYYRSLVEKSIQNMGPPSTPYFPDIWRILNLKLMFHILVIIGL